MSEKKIDLVKRAKEIIQQVEEEREAIERAEEKFHLKLGNGPREPNLFDLIQQYFPEKYAKKYSDPEKLLNYLNFLLRPRPLIPGTSQHYYEDRCRVHAIATDIHEKHPEYRASKIAEDKRIKEIAGANYTYYKRRTIKDWIREVVKHRPGRPKKPRK